VDKLKDAWEAPNPAVLLHIGFCERVGVGKSYVSTVALAAEMTCTVAEANGYTMAAGGDGKESKVTAPGVKVGFKINCDDKETCTKKLMQ
jgi:hypothetical protein